MLTQSGRTLLLFAVVFSFVFFGSNALLTGSDRFWQRAAKTRAPRDRPLRTEAALRRAVNTEPVVLLGSSVVASDVNIGLLTRTLGQEEILPVWLPGGTGLELGMLSRKIRAAKPRVLAYLATPWSLIPTIDLSQTRFYDPVFALMLFEPHEWLTDHTEHAAHLLSSGHVVVRHRATLRRMIFSGWAEDVSPAPRRVRQQIKALEQLAESDIDCQSPHVRAIGQLGRVLSQSRVLVINTPVHPRWGQNPAIAEKMNACYAAQAKAVGFTYLSSPPATTDRDFRDPLHMMPQAQRRFTNYLAEQLKIALE